MKIVPSSTQAAKREPDGWYAIARERPTSRHSAVWLPVAASQVRMLPSERAAARMRPSGLNCIALTAFSQVITRSQFQLAGFHSRIVLSFAPVDLRPMVG